MDPLIIGLLGFLIALGLIIIGVPMALAFLTVGAGGLIWLAGWDAARGAFMSVPFLAVADFEWSVIPLFVMMGMVVFEAGIGREIFTALRNWVGNLPGGLGVATTGTCAAMGTFTGSAMATTILMAKVAYPEMRRFGYQKELSFGVVASSGTLAMIIPPSAQLVIFAILTDISIGKMLIAGVIPGFISAIIYALMIITRVKLNPNLGRPLALPPWRERITSLIYLLPAVITFIVIIVGIYKGIFTPSEAGGVGCLTVFIIAFLMKRLTWSKMRRIILESARLTVMILVIIMSVKFLLHFLIQAGLIIGFAALAEEVGSPILVVTMIMAITFIMGMFLGGPKMYLTAPIFLPTIVAVGYDPFWFGILMIKMIEVGFISPPVCQAVYITQSLIPEISGGQAIKAILPFLACDIITLALFIAFPQIITFLPTSM